jgi:hypothetical protein
MLFGKTTISFTAEAFLAVLFGARLFLGGLHSFGLGQRARMNNDKDQNTKAVK